jgi:hypothetical protein
MQLLSFDSSRDNISGFFQSDLQTSWQISLIQPCGANSGRLNVEYQKWLNDHCDRSCQVINFSSAEKFVERSVHAAISDTTLFECRTTMEDIVVHSVASFKGELSRFWAEEVDGIFGGQRNVPFYYGRGFFALYDDLQRGYTTLSMKVDHHKALMIVMDHYEFPLSECGGGGGEEKTPLMKRIDWPSIKPDWSTKRFMKLFMPRIFCASSCRLKNALSTDLGFSSVFNLGADLTPLTSDLAATIGDVVNEVSIEILPALSDGSFKDRQLTTDRFMVDRPFVFIVFDRNNNDILFTGVINKV